MHRLCPLPGVSSLLHNSSFHWFLQILLQSPSSFTSIFAFSIIHRNQDVSNFLLQQKISQYARHLYGILRVLRYVQFHFHVIFSRYWKLLSKVVVSNHTPINSAQDIPLYFILTNMLKFYISDRCQMVLISFAFSWLIMNLRILFSWVYWPFVFPLL